MASPRRKAGAAVLACIATAVALALAAPASAQSVEHWNADIAEASARFGIPAHWIRRVINAESAGRIMLDGRPITSRIGAMGLMQLMPGTWRDMRAMLHLGDDPYDPRDNILAGTAYLRLMYDRFGYPGLFAAYHAGPARYAAFLSDAHALPVETRSYLAALAPETLRKFAMASPSAAGIFALRASARGGAQSQPPRAHPSSLFVTLGGSPH
jgi:soluble lytic murein transglycosylase-like protein